VDRGFTIANGIGWSPDDRTMYVTDTHARRIYRYDFDRATGRAANRQVFVEIEPGAGGPDGLTVDADGHVWSAQFDRGCIDRYRPDGRLESRIELPVQRPTSCTFGGADLDTLYVTSARMDLTPDALAAQPESGGLFALVPGVRGIPEPRFAG
jgi:sugar lactone lactonase YvrE